VGGDTNKAQKALFKYIFVVKQAEILVKHPNSFGEKMLEIVLSMLFYR